jgi:hypothetical protein
VLLGAAAPAVPLYVAGRVLGLLPSGLEARKEEASPASPVASPNVDAQGASSAEGSGRPRNSSSSSSIGSNVGSPFQSPEELTREAAAVAGKGLVPYMSWYFNQASKFTWWVHDVAIEPVLGSGSKASRP